MSEDFTFIWNDAQQAAIDEFAKWWNDSNPDKPYFFLAGVAGSGKSTLANYLASFVGEDKRVVYAAFTGKAALVMQRKGCFGACTIHSLCYLPIDDVVTDVNAKKGELGFVLRDSLYVSQIEGEEPKPVGLVIIDEVSMVGEAMAHDLMSFKVPILVLGDTAQLPPVKDNKEGGFFIRNKPDYELTQIVRQAADNPIIQLSMRVRRKQNLEPGVYDSEYGQTRIVLASKVDSIAEMQACEQMLCGTNRRRYYANWINRRIRGHKRNDIPQVGERILCLRNAKVLDENHKTFPVFNGMLFTVVGSSFITTGPRRGWVAPDDWDYSEAPPEEPYLNMKLAEEVTGHVVQVTTPYALFEKAITPEENVIQQFLKEKFRSFEWGFGYCLTVHKSQGSQWDKVLLVDESETFRQDRYRWLYTGITRAAKSVTVVTYPAPVPVDPAYWGCDKFTIPEFVKEKEKSDSA